MRSPQAPPHSPPSPLPPSRSIKTDGGALAVLTLDASGGAARQRVLVVGDQSRCQLAGKSSAPELQEVRVLIFLAIFSF